MTIINNIAYCGLYCPKCYKNSVADAAEGLKRVIIHAKDVCRKKYLMSGNMGKELNNLITLKCVNFCRTGGGKSDCKIKICCLNKKIDGYWQCDDFEKCDLLNCRFRDNIGKIKQLGIEKFVSEYQF